MQILSGTHDAHDLLPAGSVIDLELNKVVELVIPAGTVIGGPHPFHLHGVSTLNIFFGPILILYIA